MVSSVGYAEDVEEVDVVVEQGVGVWRSWLKQRADLDVVDDVGVDVDGDGDRAGGRWEESHGGVDVVMVVDVDAAVTITVSLDPKTLDGTLSTYFVVKDHPLKSVCKVMVSGKWTDM